MKKTLIVLSLLLLMFTAAMAQTIINEGFETGNTAGTPVAGWTQTSEAGTGMWTAGGPSTTGNGRGAHSGTGFAFLAYSNTRWLNKEINLEAGKTYNFSMYARQDASTGCQINVTCIPSGGIGKRDEVVATTQIGTTWTKLTGTITPSAGGPYILGIKGTLNGTPWYVSIDDILLEVSVSNDLDVSGINAITSSGLVGDPVTLSATITNNGLLEATNKVVTFQAGATTVGTAIVANLNPGSSVTVNCSSTWIPETAGDVVFTASVEPDENTANDSKNTTVNFYTPYPSLSENFDNSSGVLPARWKVLKSQQSSSVSMASYGYNTAPYTAAISNSTSNSETLMLVSPAINSLNAKKVKFMLKGGQATYRLKVGTMSNPNDSTTFRLIETISTPISYTLKTVNLGTCENDRFIVFKHGLGSSYSTIYVDDIATEDLLNNDLSAGAVTYTPAAAFEGSIVTLSSVITNAGLNSAVNKAVSFKVDGNEVGTFMIENLTSGASVTASFGWTATSGVHTFSVDLPGDDLLSNNTAAVSGEIFTQGQLVESFEGSFVPSGWAADASGWTQGATANNSVSGDKHAYFTKYGSIYTSYKLITPKLSLNGTINSLSFYAKRGQTDYSEKIQVKYSLDKTTWTDLGSPAVLTAAYTKYTSDLSTIPSGNYYFAFCTSTSTNSYSTKYYYLDLVSGPMIAQELPNPAVIGTPANAATDVVITPALTWSSAAIGGIPAGYKLYFGTDNPPTNIENGTVATSPYTASALNYSTVYYWKVVPTNSVGDATDCPVWSFTTAANPTITVFPHSESFDGTIFPPNGWLNIQTNGTGNKLFDVQTSGSSPTCTPNSPQKMLRYNSTSFSEGNAAAFITPPINFSLPFAQMTFYMYRDADGSYGGSAYRDSLNIYINSTPDLSGATLLKTIHRCRDLEPVESSSAWYNYSVEFALTKTPPAPKYLIFDAGSAYGNNIFIDDIVINQGGSSSVAENSRPVNSSLMQNYPNPFNPATTINFAISKDAVVNLTVYNAKGEIVKTLVNSGFTAGYHSVNFNADGMNSGVYIYKLTTPETSFTKKMILVK